MRLISSSSTMQVFSSSISLLLFLVTLLINGDGVTALATTEESSIFTSISLPPPPPLEELSARERFLENRSLEDRSPVSVRGGLNQDRKQQQERRQKFVCGTEDPPADTLAVIKELHDNQHHGSLASLARRQVDYGERSLNIDTYFHLVTSQLRNGSITPRMLERQVCHSFIHSSLLAFPVSFHPSFIHPSLLSFPSSLHSSFLMFTLQIPISHHPCFPLCIDRPHNLRFLSLHLYSLLPSLHLSSLLPPLPFSVFPLSFTRSTLSTSSISTVLPY